MEKDDFIYIYAPPWADWSAGIKVLHYLCDELNKIGYNAFLVIHGPKSERNTAPDLRTPILTKRLLGAHLRTRHKIIALYPEGILGNPLNANFVIRWILNFPSLLAGPVSFANDTVLAYSEILGRALTPNSPIPVLFIPAIKVDEIESLKSWLIPKDQFEFAPYELIYAQKFRALGGKLPNLRSNEIEITRFGRNAPSRKETLKLISCATVVHVYENTTVISEALLFGVPVVCHTNRFFNQLIAGTELDMVGVSWDSNTLAVPNAEYNLNVLRKAEKNARKQLQKIFESLYFNEEDHAVRPRIIIPKRGIITKHSLSRAKTVLTQKGPGALFRFFKNYAFRNQ